MGKAVTFFILGVAGVYLLLIYKPGLYFNKKASHEFFTVHSRKALPENFDKVLDEAREKIVSSEIFVDGLKLDIYLPSTPGEYEFFTPLLEGQYFRHNPLTGAVFLAAADFEKKEARTAPGKEDDRPLSGVIIAAGAFELTRLKLKPLTYISMRKWKVRGYGELLSGGTGWFNVADACSKDDRAGLADYRYGLMLDTVLKQENMFYNDFLGRSFNQKLAEERFRQANCAG